MCVCTCVSVSIEGRKTQPTNQPTNHMISTILMREMWRFW